LAAFSVAAGRFLRFPIGDRRGTRMRASASERPVTRAQALQARANSSGVAPASPQVAYRALLERCIGRPRARPKKVGRIFGPRRGLRLPAWPRLGHNFANDLAVSIDERHSPLRFIAAERLRGRVKRRARGGMSGWPPKKLSRAPHGCADYCIGRSRPRQNSEDVNRERPHTFRPLEPNKMPPRGCHWGVVFVVGGRRLLHNFFRCARGRAGLLGMLC